MEQMTTLALMRNGAEPGLCHLLRRARTRLSTFQAVLYNKALTSSNAVIGISADLNEVCALTVETRLGARSRLIYNP